MGRTLADHPISPTTFFFKDSSVQSVLVGYFDPVDTTLSMEQLAKLAKVLAPGASLPLPLFFFLYIDRMCHQTCIINTHLTCFTPLASKYQT